VRKSRTDTAETRQRIVAVASREFMAKGLATTGIADIMAAAGLTQGGFYRHFESKEQLIAEASALAFAQGYEVLEASIAGKTRGEALKIMIDLYLQQLQRVDSDYLCPLANIGSELRINDEAIKATACEGYRRLAELFGRQAELVDLLSDVEIGYAVVSTLAGAIMLSRLAKDPASAEAVLRSAKSLLLLLLQKEH